MRRIIYFAILLIIFFTACTLPNMVLEESFKTNATEYTVEGRTGWTKKKPMTFGNYQATSVKRGWTSTYNIPFIVKFQGSKHKISFDMFDGHTQNANTYALGKITSRELPILNGLFNIPLEYESYFAGVIQYNQNESYNFAIPLPFEVTFQRTEPGIMELGETVYEIHKVNQLEGQMKFQYNELVGYEIRKKGQPVAAVQKVNKDKIWISNTISKKEKFILANLCGAIMLMQNLEEEINAIETDN